MPCYRHHLDDRQVHRRWIDPRLYSIRVADVRTSNLPFSGWEATFKDPMTTAAAIDRLVHHSVIVELNLPSYRVEQAKKAKRGRAAVAEEVPPS
jgi:hypothetical protein